MSIRDNKKAPAAARVAAANSWLIGHGQSHHRHHGKQRLRTNYDWVGWLGRVMPKLAPGVWRWRVLLDRADGLISRCADHCPSIEMPY
jgi:hypothetical protein